MIQKSVQRRGYQICDVRLETGYKEPLLEVRKAMTNAM